MLPYDMLRLITRSLIVLHLANFQWALADSPPSACFNFDKKVGKPLVPPLPLKSETEFALADGKIEDKIDWGSGRGLVSTDISTVYAWLLDHKNWKDLKRTEIKVKSLPNANFLELHEMVVDLHVFAFIYINWVEQWAYELLKGTAKMPEQILASYQKVSGTDHLKQLCGSVLLTKKGENKTDVFFYEQAIAAHYDQAMIVEMHGVHLKTIAELNKPKPPPVPERPKAKNQPTAY